MKAWAVLLTIAAVLGALFSMMFVSEATMGVWMMAGAVLAAALGRIAQAQYHHSELLAKLSDPQYARVVQPQGAAASKVGSAQA